MNKLECMSQASFFFRTLRYCTQIGSYPIKEFAWDKNFSSLAQNVSNEVSIIFKGPSVKDVLGTNSLAYFVSLSSTEKKVLHGAVL
jgi:hypothetical protein